jgi:hypothetical protein
MTSLFPSIAAFLVLPVQCALAAREPLTATDISEAFGIPADSILHSDKTSEAVARHGDSILSASLFAFPAEPYVSMQVVVSRGNTVLSKPVLSRLQSGQSQMTKVELDQSVEAYVGTEGFGPGGEGHVAVAHIANLDLDFRIRLILSSDGAEPVDLQQAGISELVRNKEALYRGMAKLATSLNSSLATEKPVPSKAIDRLTERQTDGNEQRSPGTRSDADHEQVGGNALSRIATLLAVLIGVCLIALMVRRGGSRSRQGGINL